MKKDYINLYLDNVVSRLPQKDRDEVRKELSSNIYDMLSDSPNDEEIKTVLESLGSPSELAGKYSSNPRYIISPAVYDDYINVLKIVVPIVAIVSAFVGLMSVIIGAITSITEVSEILAEIIGSFISSFISSAFNSAVYITLGFMIYERTNNANKKDKPNVWKIDQLKEVNINTQEKHISLAGSVSNIVITLCLSIFFMLVSLNIFPDLIWLKIDDIKIYSIFSKEFLNHCLYVIPVLAAVSIFIDILKIKKRKWTKEILLSSIATSVIYMVLITFLFTRPNMLSVEFLEFLKTLPISSHEIINALSSGRAISIVGIAIVVVISLINITNSIYKIIKINRA